MAKVCASFVAIQVFVLKSSINLRLEVSCADRRLGPLPLLVLVHQKPKAVQLDTTSIPNHLTLMALKVPSCFSDLIA